MRLESSRVTSDHRMRNTLLGPVFQRPIEQAPIFPSIR